MRERKRHSLKIKRVIISLVFASVLAIIFLFGGKMFVSNVMATNEVQEPILLSELDIKKDPKIPPMQFDGEIRKVAYLTIDDGPSKDTTKLLNILKEANAKATFFLIGPNINLYPEQIKAMEKDGHYVGMHSMSHDYNKLYNQKKLVQEMIEVQDIIHNLNGKTPKLFRAPYGSFPGMDEGIRKGVKKAGLKTWDWTIDSNDWRYQNNPKQIVEEIRKQLTEPMEVILIHDKKGTIEALPAILKLLKDEGYELEVYNENQHFPLNFWKDNDI